MGSATAVGGVEGEGERRCGLGSKGPKSSGALQLQTWGACTLVGERLE